MEAGNQLFQRHSESIYRFFANKAERDVADLVQRTFLACVESKDNFRKQSSFRTYLFTVARNELYGYWRKRSKKEDLDVGASSLRDLGPSPSTLVGAKNEDRLLLEALRAIPLDLQLAIELHYWEGFKSREVAEVLDIPHGTVRSRLRRAKDALRAKMEELTSSGELLKSTLDNLERWAVGTRQTAEA